MLHALAARSGGGVRLAPQNGRPGVFTYSGTIEAMRAAVEYEEARNGEICRVRP